MALYDDTGGRNRNIKREKMNMFTAGGGHARLSRRQGTDLWIDIVYKLVPFYAVEAWLRVPRVKITFKIPA